MHAHTHARTRSHTHTHTHIYTHCLLSMEPAISSTRRSLVAGEFLFGAGWTPPSAVGGSEHWG